MKTNINILVQGANQTGSEFAFEINEFIDSLYEQEKVKVSGMVVCFPTSSSDGRQTMTIQWQEETKVDNIMIEGLVNDLMNTIESHTITPPQNRDLIKSSLMEKINKFYNQ